MRTAFRLVGYGIGFVLLIALLFALWAWFASSRMLGRVHEAAPESLARPTAFQLADAGRQARINGCVSCHASAWKVG